MNLFKVDHIIYEYDNQVAEFETKNDVWKINSKNIKFGLTINHKYCLIYIDDEMYIDLDKMNLEVINLLKNSKKYKIEDNHIIFIAIDGRTVIFIGDEKIIKEYEAKNTLYDSKYKFSTKEYIIKKLLE